MSYPWAICCIHLLTSLTNNVEANNVDHIEHHDPSTYYLQALWLEQDTFILA